MVLLYHSQGALIMAPALSVTGVKTSKTDRKRLFSIGFVIKKRANRKPSSKISFNSDQEFVRIANFNVA